METTLSFCELRTKEVINVGDGRRLGRPTDLIFDARARVKGIVTPAPKKGIGWKREEDIFLPWNSIVKIGDDVILVNLGLPPSSGSVQPPAPPPAPPCEPQC